MSFIYLATPYSHPLASIQKSRYEASMDACVQIAKLGIAVYSPINHWHMIGERHALPGDHQFWRLQDEAMMASCHEGWFLAISGWEASQGLNHEWQFLRSRGKFCQLISFESLLPACQAYKSSGASNARTQQMPETWPPFQSKNRPLPELRSGEAKTLPSTGEAGKEFRSSRIGLTSEDWTSS